jgi:hypothetical protein
VSRKPGKKIDTFDVRTPFQTVTVDLRCDTASGMFYVEYNETMFENADVRALKQEVNDAVVAAASVSWARYIVIEYEAKTGERFRDGDYSYYGDSLAIDKDRPVEARTKQLADPAYDADYDDDESNKVVYGIELSWFVCEYSDPLNVGRGRTARLLRHVNEQTGEASKKIEQQRDEEIPDNAILFSDSRLAVLRELRDAIGKVDHQLVQLFRGARADVAARLDVLPVSMQPLAALPMPPMPERPAPTPKKARRR